MASENLPMAFDGGWKQVNLTAQIFKVHFSWVALLLTSRENEERRVD